MFFNCYKVPCMLRRDFPRTKVPSQLGESSSQIPDATQADKPQNFIFFIRCSISSFREGFFSVAKLFVALAMRFGKLIYVKSMKGFAFVAASSCLPYRQLPTWRRILISWATSKLLFLCAVKTISRAVIWKFLMWFHSTLNHQLHSFLCSSRSE